jgi:hypothetical protein
VVGQAYGSTLSCYCFVYPSCHSWILLILPPSKSFHVPHKRV